MLSDKTIKKTSFHSEKFKNQKPFRYVVIDNFLSNEILEKLISGFPAPKKEEMVNEWGGTSLKHTVPNVRDINRDYEKFDKFIQSKEFLNYIERVTGIEGLIYDPNYFGGGTHNNLSGQGMDVHVDFNLYDLPAVGVLHRRLNAIIYLNEEWKEEWGGMIELHSDPFDPLVDEFEAVLPIKNRLVLFETNEHSWHGFKPVTEQVPNGITRKSFAIYFYTKDRPDEEKVASHATFYVPKIDADTPFDFERFYKQRNHCLNLIKMLYKKEIALSQVISDREYEISNLQSQLPKRSSKEKPTIELLKWGPDNYSEAELSNIQPSGDVGIWIQIKNASELTNPCLVIDECLVIRELVIEGELITALLPKRLFEGSSIHVQLISQYDEIAMKIGEIKYIKI